MFEGILGINSQIYPEHLQSCLVLNEYSAVKKLNWVI